MNITSVPQAGGDAGVAPVTPDNLRARALAAYHAVEEQHAAEQAARQVKQRQQDIARLRQALSRIGIEPGALDAPEVVIDGLHFTATERDYRVRLLAGLPCGWCGEPVYEECLFLYEIGLLLHLHDAAAGKAPPDHASCMRERAARERPAQPVPEPAPLDVRDFLADAIKALVAEVLDERAGAEAD